MKSLAKYKGTLIALVLFAVGFFIYNAYVKELLFKPVETQSAAEVGADLVEIYNELQAVSFESDLFKSSSYKSLKDFSTPLPVIQPGRSNPFDVIGRD